MKLTPEQIKTFSAALADRGENDSNDHIYECLHECAEDAAEEIAAESGIEFSDLSLDDQETLTLAYKNGFWEPCHMEERQKGRKALEVLGRLHDAVSDYLEAGMIEGDTSALASFLVNESLPLFGEGERAKAPAVAAPAAADRPVPPDPEGQNEERAGWAASALDEFQSLTGADAEDSICDLLANLGHYADRNGYNLKAEVRRAAMHYTDETSGKGGQFDFLSPVPAE